MTAHQIAIGSTAFVENVKHNKKLAEDLKNLLSTIRQGGSEKAREKHLIRGKMLPIERILGLLDPQTSFLELSQLAGYDLYDDSVPCGGILTGIGLIHGQLCMIIANDPTVKGGTYFPITIKKHLRAQEIAEKNNLPCLYLVDSGGAFLPKQDEVFPDKEHFGRIFYNQARMSAKGIPQIAVVLGSCTAGGAYVPAMSDQTIMVREQATIFLGGPHLVKAATGEDVSAEQLGGADVHCKTSGVADYYAQDEREALKIARTIVGDLPAQELKSKAFQPETPAKHTDESIYGFIPNDLKKPFDTQGIIDSIVDKDSFHPFKTDYGQSLICGFAKLMGHSVGLIANDGILFSESAQKGAHFIELCTQRQIPLIFLQNIMGFMVGQKYEAEGIAKHGAKLVTAVSCADVPKLTVLIGGSFGAGNYGMCGRAYDPSFLFMWPNARISVMGGEQAATVLSLVQQQTSAQKGKKISTKELETFQKPILDQYERQGHPYYASARLWDDGVIDPKDTRSVLARCLDIVSLQGTKPTKFGVFRM